MFEYASVTVMLQDNGKLEVCKIETDKKAQAAICQSYAQAYSMMLEGTEYIAFDGNYSPGADETLCIHDFALEEMIRDAVETPAGINSFVPNETNKDKIKAIFVGEICDGKMVIAFQKFKKEQYISVKALIYSLIRKLLCRRNALGFLFQMKLTAFTRTGNYYLNPSLWQSRYSVLWSITVRQHMVRWSDLRR